MKKSLSIKLTLVSATVALVAACEPSPQPIQQPNFSGQVPSAYCDPGLLQRGQYRCDDDIDSPDEAGYVPVYIVDDGDNGSSFFWMGSMGRYSSYHAPRGSNYYKSSKTYSPSSISGYRSGALSSGYSATAGSQSGAISSASRSGSVSAGGIGSTGQGASAAS